MKKGKLFFCIFLILLYLVNAQEETTLDQNEVSILIEGSPLEGKAPLKVQFTSTPTGTSPFSYEWDFDNDNKTDSTEQNPFFTYSSAGEYNATVVVIDSLGNNASESIIIVVTPYESPINIVSCFPNKLVYGENQIVCIISNSGETPLNNIAAKIVGVGIQHMSSTTISSLNPSDQDSITLKVNVLQTGNLQSTIKILDKNFPFNFEVMQEIQYSKEELEPEFNKLKEEFSVQEGIYYEKKADGYPVSETFESMKIIQGQIRTIQQQLLTNELQKAKVNMELLSLSIIDLKKDLENIKKPKVTLLMWMKENALAITAIIAALGTLSGVIIKIIGHAKKVKEHAKNIPLKFKKEAKSETEVKKE